MKGYRTDKQYTDIVENCINGNWTDAGKLAEESGFYASDLIKKHEERKELGGITFDDPTDIALVAEMAQKNRNQ